MTAPEQGTEAAPASFDAVVVGAGPAGTLAAHAMARRGMRVGIIDRARFPRDKVCGCCLNQGAIEILERCGLDGVIPQDAPVLGLLRIVRRGRIAEIRTRPGVAISRSRLDHALLAAATGAGAVAFTETSATLGPFGPGGWTIRLRSRGAESQLVSRTVVCADGLSGGFLPAGAPWRPTIAADSRMGLGARLDADAMELPPGRIDMHVGNDGYLGIVRLIDGTIDIAAAVRPAFVRAHATPAEAMTRLLQADSDRIGAALAGAAIRGTPLLTRRRSTLEHDGVFVAGDAASYVEPFTGEGMSWAMASGVLAADACAAWVAGGYRPGAYAAALRRGLGFRRTMCRALSKMLRSPVLVDAAMAFGSRIPRGASMVSERIGAPLRLALEPGA